MRCPKCGAVGIFNKGCYRCSNPSCRAVFNNSPLREVLGIIEGREYRNRNRGGIVTVIYVNEARRLVRLYSRCNGVTELPVADFLANYTIVGVG